jgi:hypothetical protein
VLLSSPARSTLKNLEMRNYITFGTRLLAGDRRATQPGQGGSKVFVFFVGLQ